MKEGQYIFYTDNFGDVIGKIVGIHNDYIITLPLCGTLNRGGVIVFKKEERLMVKLTRVKVNKLYDNEEDVLKENFEYFI